MFDSSCDFKLNNLSLYGGRHSLDDHTNIEEHGDLRDEVWITDRTQIRAEDNTGIEVAIFGFLWEE
jgi:hypothetical protein